MIPEQADDNANAIPDRWEAAHLGPFGGDAWADPDGDGLPGGIEYVFGTAAGRPTADPRRAPIIGKVLTARNVLRGVWPVVRRRSSWWGG